MVRNLIRNIAGALTLACAGGLAAAAEADADADAGITLQKARQAALADPGNPASRFALGVLLIDRQADDEAMDLFIAMTQQFPSLPEPYNNIALLHARAGRWDAARLALEAALRNDPGHRVARENLGDVHLQLAVQAWAAAASGAAGPALQHKLKLGRELAVANGTAAIDRSR
jgi:tetratricopeptide (TPR) repeat protein